MEEKAKFDFKQELDAARTIRDELRLKAHLAKADVKDEFNRLETRFHQIEEDLRRASTHVKEPAEVIGKKSAEILRELTSAFESVRRRFTDSAS